MFRSLALTLLLTGIFASAPLRIFAAERPPSQQEPLPEVSGTLSAAAKTETPSRNPEWATLVDESLNLYRVAPLLYRCAQFTQSDLSKLEVLGFKTTVNLRNAHSDTEILRNSSIKQIRIPMKTWSIGDKQVIAALVAVRLAQQDGPVLLHCHHGADRTGLITAMYRILYQGWTREAALDELRHGGYGFHTVWRNIPRYLEKVNLEKIARAVEEKVAAQTALRGAGERE